MAKRILIAVLILLILSQFIQPPHNNGNAEAATDFTHLVTVPDSIRAILKTSCYDCHTNHTNYPWYSKITPVNWWLNDHINSGKQSLNFTTFTTYTHKKMAHRMDDIAETVEKNEMPLKSYLWIHTNAKLNEAQKKMLIDWSKTAKEDILKDSLQGRR